MTIENPLYIERGGECQLSEFLFQADDKMKLFYFNEVNKHCDTDIYFNLMNLSDYKTKKILVKGEAKNVIS